MPLCEDDSGGVGGCGTSFDHWAGREDAAGMVEIEPGSIWHRLQHDKPVSMTPEEDAELLSVSRKIILIGCVFQRFQQWSCGQVFNAYERQRSASAEVEASRAWQRDAMRESAVWEDLSTAR